VQLVGGAGDRGVRPDEPVIGALPTGKPAQAGAVVRAAVRRDLLGEHRAVPRERRVRHLVDQPVPLGRERGAVDAAAGGRRGPAQRVAVPVGQVTVEVGDRGVDQVPHRPAARGHAGAVPVGHGGEHPGDGAQPREVALGMGRFHDPDHRQAEQQPGRGRDVARGDGVLDAAGGDLVQHGPGVAPDHRAGQPVARRQRGRIEGPRPGSDVADAGGHGALGRLAVVAQPVVPVPEPGQRGQQRIPLVGRVQQFVGELDCRCHGQNPVARCRSAPCDPIGTARRWRRRPTAA
jgi:hypothetical protein